MDAVTHVPTPVNEPPRTYAPDGAPGSVTGQGSGQASGRASGRTERGSLTDRLGELWAAPTRVTNWIDGAPAEGTGEPFDVVAPFEHAHVLGTFRSATSSDTATAI